MEIYDQIYRKMCNLYNLINRSVLKNVPHINGAVFKIYSSIVNLKPIHKSLPKRQDEYLKDTVVSLTSYGERVNTVSTTIYTLIKQSLQPEKIVLWLARDEFKNGVIDLPDHLISLLEECDWFDIMFCDDLKSHKKYFYAMKMWPEKTIITTDDDVFYPTNWLQSLYEAHSKNHKCVICNVARQMTIDTNGILAPYETWDEVKKSSGPSIMLCPIGVGGVLYPPDSLKKEYLFDEKFIRNNCFNADDLWLKMMGVMKGTLVVRTGAYTHPFLEVKGTSKNKLSSSNVLENKNDIQLRNIISRFNDEIREELCENRL